MPINFNPSISFKADNVVSEQPEVKTTEQPQETVVPEQKPDEFVKTQVKEEPIVINENKQEINKNSLTPVEYAKSYVKDKTNANPLAYSVAKGIVQGAAVGAGFLGMSWIFNVLPKVSKKGPKFMEVLKHPLKHMDKSGKIIAASMGALMLGYTVLSEILKEKAGLNVEK